MRLNDVSALSDGVLLAEAEALVADLCRPDWSKLARREQLPPDGDWRVWYMQGGRGSGKTRAGAEWLAKMALETPGEWGVVAPTYRDARDVCVEGPSGLIKALGPHLNRWNRSMGELFLKNGSVIRCDAADDGGVRIQGKNLNGVWCDEIGLWNRWERAWKESISFAVRVEPALIICTGTPKRGHGLVQLLTSSDNPSIAISRMKMRDNIANLSIEAVEDLERLYEGTLLGRQELDGEVIEDVEGALWTEFTLNEHRVAAPPRLVQTVIGVDPAGSSTGTVGIVAVGVSEEKRPHPRTGQPIRHMYVLGDRSMKGEPEKWAAAAIDMMNDYNAVRIVAERNYGGDMVEAVIRQVDVTAPVKMVSSSQGKNLRAEPIAAISTQGLLHMVGRHPELEAQMTTWVHGESNYSPDRLDAMVFAATELLPHLRQRGGIYMPRGSRLAVPSRLTPQSRARIRR